MYHNELDKTVKYLYITRIWLTEYLNDDEVKVLTSSVDNNGVVSPKRH